MVNSPIIKMRNIEKTYIMGKNNLTVLNGISLDIQKGEFVAILGPSGSGKSTLMNIIGCIDIADRGEYSLANEDISARNDDELAYVRNRKIGFVFQRFNLLPKYTAIHNVAFPLLLRGMSKNEAYAKAETALNEVGLGDRLTHKPMELSGGQQQRVSIARAVVGDPDIILADEPTGSLDSKSGKEIIEMFNKLNVSGNTIVLITHDNEIAKKAGRIIHVRDGNIYNM